MQQSSKLILPLIATLAILSACSQHDPINPNVCEPQGNLQPICKFNSPEDLLALPDQRHLLVSEYGTYFDANPGALVLFNPQTQTVEKLDLQTSPTEPLWLESECSEAPGAEMSPHGINLSRRSNGALQLLVVNHAPRERIEWIELKPTNNTYSAHWRGCLYPPENAYINSVAATPEGGLVMTHMFPKDSPTIGTTALSVALSTLGRPSGHVIEWQPETGFNHLEYTEGGFPNGILVSPEGRFMFVAYSTGNQVVKFDRINAKPLEAVQVEKPDNLRWTEEGQILVVGSPISGLEAIQCQENSREGVQCAAGFEVTQLDPELKESEKLFRHPGGPPMGGATVAVQFKDDLYIGSFAGNRLLKLSTPH
ncbi:MAG: hypothetical protein R3194_06515 [Limnobacter sp.]|nr:hypothetical protein [Limnobacter sp.]